MADSIFSSPIVFEKLDSTNAWLRTRCEKEPVGGICVVAKEQSLGRGRSGRSFVSPKGGAYFSFSLTDNIPMEYIPTLTILAGLAANRAIFALTGLETEIKWPNDLLLQKKKLCGILTEGCVSSTGVLQYAIIGIGINLAGKSSDFPSELQPVLCTLEEAGFSLSPKEVIDRVLYEFETLYDRGNFYRNMREITALYTRNLAYRGEFVSIIRGEQETGGRLIGVNDNGEALLRAENGNLIIIPSGEMGLRPKAENLPEKICTFSGNRTLSHPEKRVKEAIEKMVLSLAEEGFVRFRAGGADGFDQLAAEAVIKARQQHPHLQLEILLPYPEFGKSKPHRAEILDLADEVKVISPQYHPNCFRLRNEALLEGAHLLLFYNHQNSGGTVQTASMADKLGIPLCPLEL